MSDVAQQKDQQHDAAKEQSRTAMTSYDVVVIGGGINGVGIAADAAARGLSVYLCEQHDLASHTSSASTKLIHGGLRYLEQFQFRLVREALAEREVLMNKAPHLIYPLRFVLPHRPFLRPAWLIQAGLFLYDHLGARRHLAASKRVKFAQNDILQAHLTQGFEYSDCWVDDARLVVANALQAAADGAVIATRTRCVAATTFKPDARQQAQWLLTLQQGSQKIQVQAKAVVNAAGPWVAQLLQDVLEQPSTLELRLVKGSHIVVPKLYQGDQAFILQNTDRRIVFAIPYLQQFTLIGTTDQDYTADPAQVSISDAEIDYLIEICNAHFCAQLTPQSVLHHYAGVRPLWHQKIAPSAKGQSQQLPAAKVSRDYLLHFQMQPAPLLLVYGGKLTTYRKLAEAAVQHLQAVFSHLPAMSTAQRALPGGENWQGLLALQCAIQQQLPEIELSIATRWASAYGHRVWQMLNKATSIQQLGPHFGAGLYAREIDFLTQTEWAKCAEDILYRRSKLGLLMNQQQIVDVEQYLQMQQGKISPLTTDVA